MIHYTNINKDFSIPDMLEDGTITKKSGLIKRDSKVSFIDDLSLRKEIFNFINDEYCKKWHTQLTDIEPLQYSEYDIGGEYGWHRDVHDNPYSNGLVRKISFSTILNNDYLGGEFDIETRNPNSETRYDTFEGTIYNTIIFPAYMWHRVRPVKSGIRKSIVGWVLGPP